MNELIAKIEQWAEDRNIIKGSKPIDQAMKLFSEFGELADNVGKGCDIKDDCGDIFVVLTIMAKQYGYPVSIHNSWDNRIIDEISVKSKKEMIAALGLFLNFVSLSAVGAIENLAAALTVLQFIAKEHNSTLEECVQIAYNDIKDRRGILVNGVFIKESDPAYASAVAAIESNYDIEEDAELNAIADSRKDQKRISVNIEDL